MSLKQQLLDEHEKAFREFHSLSEDLDEREFERKWLDGRWGVRELAAHITGWHGQLAAGLERLARGEPLNPPGEEWDDVEGLNHTFAEHAKGKLKDEVLFELQRAVESLRRAAEKLPDEEFAEGQIARKLLMRAGIEHFREHAEQVRAWRRERQESPTLT